jgi:hypothetical protein
VARRIVHPEHGDGLKRYGIGLFPVNLDRA